MEQLDGTGAKEALAERMHQAELSAAVGVALTTAEPLQRQLQRCAEAAVEWLGAAFARIWTLNDAEGMLELQASAGLYTNLDGPHGRVAMGADHCRAARRLPQPGEHPERRDRRISTLASQGAAYVR